MSITIKSNETRTLTVKNETVNGIHITAVLQADSAGQYIPHTKYMSSGVAFDPSNVNVEVYLMRNGMAHPILNSNLAVIAHYNTILMGGELWRKGIPLQHVVDATGNSSVSIMSRDVFVYFGGHLNVSGSDELIINVTVNRSTFGTGLDVNNSLIQVEHNQSIGVEYAIHRQHFYAIQANQVSETVNLGDNVTRLAFISFNKDSHKPVFKTVSLSSDRLDFTLNEHGLISKRNQFVGYSLAQPEFYQGDYTDLDTSIPMKDAKDLNPYYYPSTFILHDKDEIDKAKVSYTMHSQNVLPSQNFVAYTTFVTSQEIIQKAVRMKERHAASNFNKIKETL